jgi:hypothetical protein
MVLEEEDLDSVEASVADLVAAGEEAGGNQKF